MRETIVACALLAAACGSRVASPPATSPSDPGDAGSVLVAPAPPKEVETWRWKTIEGGPPLTATSVGLALDERRLFVVDAATLAGGIFDADARRWTKLAAPRLPKVWPQAESSRNTLEHGETPFGVTDPRQRAVTLYPASVVAAHVGDYVVVWAPSHATAMRYHLARGAWEAMDTDGAPEVWSPGVVVIGGKLLVFAGDPINLALGFAYDPAEDRWDRLPKLDRTVYPYTSLCATRSTLYVWGGASTPNAERRERDIVDGGYAYDVARARWDALPRAGQPSRRADSVIACTERELFVWGGYARVGLSGGHESPLDDGAVYTAATRRWRRIAAPARAADAYPITASVQNHVISIDATSGSQVFDLAVGHWRKMSEGAPVNVEPCLGCALSRGPRGLRLAVAGGSLFVAGAASAGAYDPVHDAWTRIEFPWTAVRVVALLGDRLVVWGATRPADSAGCYDDHPGRCDDGKTSEAAVFAPPR